MNRKVTIALGLLAAFIVAASMLISLWQAVHHNYTENITSCRKHNLVKSATSLYAPARCTDPKTGLMYDPQYLGTAQ